MNSSISLSVRGRNADCGSDGVAGYNDEKIHNLRLPFKILRGISDCQPWQGLATGTLLYVVFFEVIEKERLKGTTGMVQVMLLYWETTPPQTTTTQVTFVLLGFVCMLGMEAVGLYFEGAPVSPTPSCVLDPAPFNNISKPVSITCLQGTVTILPE